ncbi:MAG: hypothetical protein WAX85_00190 [Minisyncoccia bacterium]
MNESGDSGNWYIEIGPVFEGPGPGDGSDANFYSEVFTGTKDDADARACHLLLDYERHYRVITKRDRVTFDPDPDPDWMDRAAGDFPDKKPGYPDYPFFHSDLGWFKISYLVTERK